MNGEQARPAGTLTGGFLINVNLVFVSTVASYALAFLTVVVIARALGPDGRGITSLYQQAVNLGFTFLSFGIGAAAVYFVSRRELTARQALECGLSVTVVSVLFTVVGVGIIALVAGDQLRGDGVPIWLAIVALPGVVQYHTLVTVLRGQGRFAVMNVLELVQPIAALGALLVIDFTRGLTIPAAVYVWSLSFWPPIVLGYMLVGRDAWPRRLAPRSVLLPAVRFGVQGQLSNLVQLLNYRLDSYLVLFFVNTAGVGLYAVGVSLSEGMWFIANSVAVVLLTDITAGGAEHGARMTPVICRNTLLVTGAGAIAAALLSPVIIPVLFGAAFEDAVVPFLLLLPGTVALAGTKILAAYVFSRGMPLINGWIALATLIVTVTVDLALIPLFGVPGAAAGASIAYVVSLALTAIVYRRLSGGTILEVLLPRPADAELYLHAARSLTARLRPARSEA